MAILTKGVKRIYIGQIALQTKAMVSPQEKILRMITTIRDNIASWAAAFVKTPKAIGVITAITEGLLIPELRKQVAEITKLKTKLGAEVKLPNAWFEAQGITGGWLQSNNIIRIAYIKTQAEEFNRDAHLIHYGAQEAFPGAPPIAWYYLKTVELETALSPLLNSAILEVERLKEAADKADVERQAAKDKCATDKGTWDEATGLCTLPEVPKPEIEAIGPPIPIEKKFPKWAWFAIGGALALIIIIAATRKPKPAPIY